VLWTDSTRAGTNRDDPCAVAADGPPPGLLATSALIGDALDFARTNGAPAVAAYPLDGAVSPSATSTGYVSTFAAAGFIEVARRSPERPIMRYTFAEDSRPK
jgi:hypothetical protein